MLQEIEVDALPVGVPLERNLYHATGALLFGAGQSLSAGQVQMLRDARVSKVHSAEGPEGLAELKRRAGLEPVAVEALGVGRALEQDICNHEGTVLLSRGQVFQEHHARVLSRAGMSHVWVVSQEEQKEFKAYEMQRMAGSLTELDDELESRPELMTVPRGPAPFHLQMMRLLKRGEAQRREIQGLRGEARRGAGDLLAALRDGAPVQTNVPEIVERMMTGLKKDANFLLNLASMVEGDYTSEDPRGEHLINVCVNSLTIGAHLGFGEEQMLQLGLSAFLHDVGMVKVQREILQKPGALTPLERVEVDRHTIFALDMLQKIPRLPEGVYLPIYQSHERLDGRGYPKNRKLPYIHEFARIIAVADAYTAMCSPRVYRKAMTPYKAMEEVVRSASKGILDREIVRGLLGAVGLYPIGSWVLLSNGETGRVVGVGRDAKRYDRPAVSLIYKRDGTRVESPKVIELADRADVRVEQVLEPEGLQRGVEDGF